MFFGNEHLNELKNEYSLIYCKLADLTLCYNQIDYKTNEARQYVEQGLLRRANILVTNVSNVFEAYPPDRTDIPSEEVRMILDINIQCSIFNTFGFLDNLAWIWFLENDVKNIKKDRSLFPGEIGLGCNYKHLRKSLPKEFLDYLNDDGMTSWFKYLESFRHALAHRIPLYVPPAQLDEEQSIEFNRLVSIRQDQASSNMK